MLDLTITKDVFEFVLPVFQSPTEHLFERLAHEISVATEEVQALIGDYADEHPIVTSPAQAYICCVAARRTLPQLDLVLTETGFGVVSNQNLVPASQARVAALDESLRQKQTIAKERLLLALLSTEWNASSDAISRISGLYWLPCHMRRHGVTVDNKPVFEDEFEALRPQLVMAEAKVISLISPELYDYLVEQERTNHKEQTKEVAVLIERVRFVIAALMKEHSHPRDVKPLVKRLLDTLELYKDKFTMYVNSSTYKAQQVPPYENKKEDSIFFFS